MNGLFKYFLFTFFCIRFSLAGFSQKETEKWYLNQFLNNPGQASALDFSSGAPVLINNNAMLTGWEGCSSISDANGNLLFYTQGLSLYNKNHAITPNGSGLLGNNSVTQVAVFVPKPGNPNIYYLFILGDPTGNAASSFSPWTLYYNEIDITMNGGLGDITATKNVLIAGTAGNSSEKMSVTKHCNGTDYWLLIHTNTGNTFKAFQISATGISAPVISNVGTSFVIGANGNDSQGQMKFSPNGVKIALALKETHAVELFDFNRSTGVVSGAVFLGGFTVESYGIEFSPDNSILYSSMTDAGGTTPYLMQWFICTGSPAASMNTFSTSLMYSLQLAPDGKIYGCTYYMNGSNSKLSVINDPNIFGTGCNYSPNGPSISPYTCGLGLPNFISSYFDWPGTFSYHNTTQTNTTNCQNNGIASVYICVTLGAAPYTYTWSNGTVIGPTGAATSSISNLPAGTYSVVINDATCMKDTAFFTITGGSATPSTQNVSICTGNTYTLPGGAVVSTSGTYKDTLLSSGGCDSIITTILSVVTSINTAQNPVICSGGAFTLPGGSIVSVAGTYKDTLTAQGGCDSIITTTLVVNAAVTINQSASICTGTSYTLPGGTVVSTAGTYNDTLTTAGGCDSIIITNLSVVSVLTSSQNPVICNGSTFILPGGSTVNVSGTYMDTLTSSGGCDSIITTNLTVNPNSVSSQSPVICSGNNFVLPGGVIATTSGTYADTLVAKNGCDSIITTNLTVNPSPNAAVSANVTISFGSSTTLTATGGGTYSWFPSTGLNSTSDSTVIASPDASTLYCVAITNSYGCKDTACVTISIEMTCGENDFYLPNAFSPNGDNENEVFMNYINPACVSEFKLVIYNRWGQKVFETEDVTQSWNGELKGTMSDPAVYAYYCKAILLSGKEIFREGNISLIR